MQQACAPSAWRTEEEQDRKGLLLSGVRESAVRQEMGPRSSAIRGTARKRQQALRLLTMRRQWACRGPPRRLLKAARSRMAMQNVPRCRVQGRSAGRGGAPPEALCSLCMRGAGCLSRYVQGLLPALAHVSARPEMHSTGMHPQRLPARAMRRPHPEPIDARPVRVASGAEGSATTRAQCRLDARALRERVGLGDWSRRGICHR